MGLPASLTGYCEGAWQSLDSYAQANGVYSQNNIFGKGQNVTKLNPAYLRFVLNQAVWPVQTDYFSCIHFSDVQSEMGVNLTSSIYWGSDLKNTIAGIINNYSVYASGNYSSGLGRRDAPMLVPAMYFDKGTNRDANQVAWGAATTVAGVSVLNAAGGTGIITGAVVGTALEVALAWTGVGLIVLGVGALIYSGYRIFTQKQGTSPDPWDYGNKDSDPAYLKRIQGRTPLLYPPLIPPPPPNEEQ